MQRSSIGRLIAALFLLPIVVLSAVLAWVDRIDLDNYIEPIGRAVEQRTGRALHIERGAYLDVSLSPTVRLNRIRLANPAWAKHPDMLALTGIELKIRLLPLLLGEIVIERILAGGGELNLEVNENGQRNWLLAGGSTETSTSSATIRIHNVEIRQLKIIYLNQLRGTQRVAALQSLTTTYQASGDRLDIEFTGALGGTELTGKMALSPLRALTNGEPLAVRTELNSAPLLVKAEGDVPTGGDQAGARMQVSIAGTDLSRAAALFGMRIPIAESYRLEFQLAVPRQDQIEFNDLATKLGESDISGSIKADFSGPRPMVRAILASQKLTMPRDPAAQGTANTVSPAPNNRIFSTRPMAISLPDEFDADVTLNVQRLVAGTLLVDRLAARLTLAPGELRIEPLSFYITNGPATGRALISTREAPAEIGLVLNANQLDAGGLVRMLTETDDLLREGKASVAIDLRSRGESVAALAGNLNGHVRALMGRGKADVLLLNAAVGGATTLLGTLTEKNSPQANVNCAAGDLLIRDGIATSQVLLVDTQYSTLYGKGQIDLTSERLNLEFEPKPKSTTLNVAVPVEVSGTLAQPRFTPSKLATARKAGGLLALAGFIFPPAAIVGLGGLGAGAVAVGGLGEIGSSENPCLRLASEKSGKPVARKSRKIQSSDDSLTEKATRSVKDAVKNIGKSLKGLFGD